MYFTHMSIEPVSVCRRIAKRTASFGEIQAFNACNRFSSARRGAGEKQQVKFHAAHTENCDVSRPYCQQKTASLKTAVLRCFRLKLAESKFDTVHANVR
jgi:hypothetical protein